MTERLAYRISEVAAMTGLSAEMVRRLCVSGALPSRKVGRARAAGHRCPYALWRGMTPNVDD